MAKSLLLNNPEQESKISEQQFIEDELYIFRRAESADNNSESLWGVVNRVKDGEISLESCSTDLRKFSFWVCLPAEYCFCRRATRFEALTYGWHCGYHEATKKQEKDR